jgi:hypothetical protein
MAKNKKFTVATPNGTQPFHGTYEISKEGILVVTPSTGRSQQLVFSPSGWWSLDVPKDD